MTQGSVLLRSTLKFRYFTPHISTFFLVKWWHYLCKITNFEVFFPRILQLFSQNVLSLFLLISDFILKVSQFFFFLMVALIVVCRLFRAALMMRNHIWYKSGSDVTLGQVWLMLAGMIQLTSHLQLYPSSHPHSFLHFILSRCTVWQPVWQLLVFFHLFSERSHD